MQGRLCKMRTQLLTGEISPCGKFVLWGNKRRSNPSCCCGLPSRRQVAGSRESIPRVLPFVCRLGRCTFHAPLLDEGEQQFTIEEELVDLCARLCIIWKTMKLRRSPSISKLDPSVVMSIPTLRHRWTLALARCPKQSTYIYVFPGSRFFREVAEIQPLGRSSEL